MRCCSWLKMGVLLIGGVFLVNFYAYAQTSVPDESAAPSMTILELQSWIKSKKPFVLLDVRQPEEHSAGHIANDILIPLNELKERANELPKDKDIVVYCRSGRRSATATAILHAQGYKKAVNLSGGYIVWTETEEKRKKLCALKSGEGC